MKNSPAPSRHAARKWGAYTPDPLVEHLLGQPLAAQTDAVNAAENASADAERLRQELAALEADTTGDVEDLAQTIAAKREAITVTERRVAAAASTVASAARRVAHAEEEAFRSDEIIARRRAILLDDGEQIGATVEALLDKLRADILEATAGRRLVSRSLAAERRALASTLTGQARAQIGNVPQWSGGEPTKNLDQEAQSFLDQARARVVRWPFARLVAQAIVGESGLSQCDGMTIYPDELTREQRDAVAASLDPGIARRWLKTSRPADTPGEVA
jgi:hypothetical protein